MSATSKSSPTLWIVALGLGCAGLAAPSGTGRAAGLGCPEGAGPTSVGAAEADPERATLGYACPRPPETTGSMAASLAARTPVRTWVGPLGPDQEKNTLGLTDGYGLRDGDGDD